MRKLLLALGIILLSCTTVFAAKIPEEVQQYITKAVPNTDIRFDGVVERENFSGFKANEVAMRYKDDILFSLRECNYLKFKTKPFGWKYGVNKSVKIKGEERVKQYAYDFYGNKEVIKTV